MRRQLQDIIKKVLAGNHPDGVNLIREGGPRFIEALRKVKVIDPTQQASLLRMVGSQPVPGPVMPVPGHPVMPLPIMPQPLNPLPVIPRPVIPHPIMPHPIMPIPHSTPMPTVHVAPPPTQSKQ